MINQKGSDMKLFRTWVMVAFLIFSSNAFAGVYADKLSECLVDSTTTQDRITLVKWMFSAMSLHPAVRSISMVSPAQLDSANKNIAELFMRLLTKSCKDETKKALKYEGRSTIQNSFRILGQVAGRELFSNPKVLKGISGIQKYIDANKLKSLNEK